MRIIFLSLSGCAYKCMWILSHSPPRIDTAECWPSTLFRCFFLLVFFSQEIANTLCRWRNEKPAYWICWFRFSWICVFMRRTSESKTETNEKKKSSTAHSLAYEQMRQPTNRWMNKRNAKPKKTVYWCVGEWFAFNEVYFIFVLRSLNVFVCVYVCGIHVNLFILV